MRVVSGLVLVTLSSGVLLAQAAQVATTASRSGERDTGVVVPNDNRTPAGELRDGVLTLRLEARKGLWHPQGEDGPGFEIEAFGEVGRPLQSPGPLIRVPAGTEVRVSLRNGLDRAVLVRGLHNRGSAGRDSVEIPPGEMQEVRFQATAPGTYHYWGRTSDDREGIGRFEDGQLGGALVVDPPGQRPDDRVLVIARWVDRGDVAAQREHVRRTFLVNGLSWPYTERLAATVGDSARWRVINQSVAPHPMHLHGFYFQVDARGDAWADSLYGPLERRLAVTEHMGSGTTMAMSWLPKRVGHWLFHCHFIAHISPEQHVRDPKEIVGDEVPSAEPGSAPAHGARHAHAFEGMAGLMVGIMVADPAGRGLREDESLPRRHLRLYANARENYFGDRPGFGYILQEGPKPPAPDSIRIPGTPIVLTRDEPVEVTVVNQTAHAVSVHWHGIELDSYYDGVGGWSGAGARIAPTVAPRDSFKVRFTPDRAGTFIYHTHMDESAQLSSGLYGPLIVLPPGEAYRPETDRIFLVGWGGPGPDAPPFLNGSVAPPPVELARGKAHRFRFINITPSNDQMVRLLDGERVVEWRRYGKDGADLPDYQAKTVAAEQYFGAGETYDFEVTPGDAGELTLEVTTYRRGGQPPAVIKVPVRVR